MLDYKGIIIRHYGGGASGSELAEQGFGSKSGINDFLRAFEACEKIPFITWYHTRRLFIRTEFELYMRLHTRVTTGGENKKPDIGTSFRKSLMSGNPLFLGTFEQKEGR